jgi:hypothetical protein
MDLVGLCRAACLCRGGRAWRQPRSTRLGVRVPHLHHIMCGFMPFKPFPTSLWSFSSGICARTAVCVCSHLGLWTGWVAGWFGGSGYVTRVACSNDTIYALTSSG